MNVMSFAVGTTVAVLLAGCAASPGSSTGTGTRMSTSSNSSNAAPASTAATTISMPDGPGRDWTKVDTNGDGSVSPDEMETWLKANPGPAAKR